MAVGCLVAALVCGCASPQKRLSREEFLAEVTRTYDLPKEQVIGAAEKVLELVDPDDMVISHQLSGMTAHRKFMWYFVIGGAFGADIWSFQVAEQNGKTIAQVQVSRHMGSVLPAPTSGGDMAAMGGVGPPGGMPWGAPELYQLFWKRVDFMLGRSPIWLSCMDWEAQMTKTMTGGMEPLCDRLTVDDVHPDGTRDQPATAQSRDGTLRP